MKTITLKSELWAHMPDVDQEYYRYEIISRCIRDDKAERVIVQHNVYRINRQGEMVIPDDWYMYRNDEDIKAMLAPQSLPFVRENGKEAPYLDRQLFVEQHETIVKALIG